MRDFQYDKEKSRWHTPLKVRESRIIMIESDPFAAGFDGQCRKPRVRHQITASVSVGAKSFENLPVPLTRLNDHAVRLCKEYVAEPDYFFQAAGHCKNFRMGGDAYHTAQDLSRHTIAAITVDHSVKPGPADLVVGRIRSESMHENVNVGKNHGAFMASSSSLVRFKSIPGRTPPVALDIGNSTRSRRFAFGLAKMSISPSSTSDVRVRPSSAARFLARFSRSSRILIVVLMHQYITMMHKYVKQSIMSQRVNITSVA